MDNKGLIAESLKQACISWFWKDMRRDERIVILQPTNTPNDTNIGVGSIKANGNEWILSSLIDKV